MKHAFYVAPSVFGLKAYFWQQGYFFLGGFDYFTATETEWGRRGYRVINRGKPQHTKRWNGQHYTNFYLYRFEQCREIGGKKAAHRRFCYKWAVYHLVEMRSDFVKMEYPQQAPDGWRPAEQRP